MSILEVKALKKVYTTRFGSNQVTALKNVNFSVEQGEFVAIMGESGSGKTTLLNILAALDKPTSGSVLLNGKDITQISESRLAQFRRDNLGFVFQDFNLLDTFNLEDNIYLPLVLANVPYKQMIRRLNPIAKMLGIKDLLKKYPYEPEIRRRRELPETDGTAVPEGRSRDHGQPMDRWDKMVRRRRMAVVRTQQRRSALRR